MRILMTGGTSFTAQYLLPELQRRYPEAEVTLTSNAAIGPLPSGVGSIQADLAEGRDARALIAEVRPVRIYHLAGFSGRDADLCFRVNLDSTRNLLEAAAELPEPPRTLHVSSAAVYGMSQPGESPLPEDAPLRPVASYGASKAAAELAALTYFHQQRYPVVIVRPFNLLGPGLRPGLAPADFLAKARAIRDGAAEPRLTVGNLAAERDFVDIRDAVRAYLDLLDRDDVWGRVFNVATGTPVSMRTILQTILDALAVAPEIVEQPDLKRQAEVQSQTGDTSALRALLGWNPRYRLKDSIAAMAEDLFP